MVWVTAWMLHWVHTLLYCPDHRPMTLARPWDYWVKLVCSHTRQVFQFRKSHRKHMVKGIRITFWGRVKQDTLVCEWWGREKCKPQTDTIHLLRERQKLRKFDRWHMFWCQITAHIYSQWCSHHQVPGNIWQINNHMLYSGYLIVLLILYCTVMEQCVSRLRVMKMWDSLY